MAQLHCIYSHEGVEVRRVCNNTNNQLVMVSSTCWTGCTCIEVHLIFWNIIYIQFRHDSISTIVCCRRCRRWNVCINVENTIFLRTKQVWTCSINIRDIRGCCTSITRLITYRPAWHITGSTRTRYISVSFREGNSTQSLRSNRLTRSLEVQCLPLRRTFFTYGSDCYVVVRLLIESGYHFRACFDSVIEDDDGVRHDISFFCQWIWIHELRCNEECPVIIGTDTNLFCCQAGIWRFRQRAVQFDDRNIIKIEQVSSAVTSSPSEVFRRSRDKVCIVAQV